MQPKKRILCFHGIATNATIMNFQLRQFQKEFDNFEFVTFDGPIVISKKVFMDHRLVKIVEDQDVFSWGTLLQMNDKYEGIGSGIEKAIKVLESDGPFHGLMGFSQGSNMVFKLCRLIEQGKLNLNYEIKLLIFFSSAPYVNLTKDNIQLNKISSLHFIGMNDFMVDKSFVMASQFLNPYIIYHNQGHKIPTLTHEQVVQVRSFLDQKKNQEWDQVIYIPKL